MGVFPPKVIIAEVPLRNLVVGPLTTTRLVTGVHDHYGRLIVRPLIYKISIQLLVATQSSTQSINAKTTRKLTFKERFRALLEIVRVETTKILITVIVILEVVVEQPVLVVEYDGKLFEGVEPVC